MDRPALQRLLQRVTAREVDRVVVHRLDRLVRSVRDWTEIVTTLKRYGAALTIVAGDLHLGDLAMNDMVLNMLAKAESAEERLADLRRRRAEAADVLAETILDLWLRERRVRREAAAREPRAGSRSV